MKTHVYIATTQGLVAIQKITPIDDQDISSVVSINGTSTTANISSSYHNFVKKGVGIIQHMFGACSYRVDISARIDQGNSWQLAMYLAHLAHSKGLLGNGEVSRGDRVICATGEVNTSNHRVLAVSAVDVKLALAQAQLQHWETLGATVAFLVPQANQHEVIENTNCTFVDHLNQAAAILPNNTEESVKPFTAPSTPVSRSGQKSVLTVIVVVALVLFFSLYRFYSEDMNDTAQIAGKENIEQKGITKPSHLVAQLKQNKTCAQTVSQAITVITKKAFADLALPSLCELSFYTNPSVEQVLLVAKDAYTVLPLTQDQQGWQIPLPQNRFSDRAYFLVSLSTSLTEDKIEQLRLYREAMGKPNLLDRSELNQWLQKQDSQFVIYSHRLLVK